MFMRETFGVIYIVSFVLLSYIWNMGRNTLESSGTIYFRGTVE